MKSVNSNLQTGSDFHQLASTCPGCKSAQKSVHKCIPAFRAFTLLHIVFIFVNHINVKKNNLRGVTVFCDSVYNMCNMSAIFNTFRVYFESRYHGNIQPYSEQDPP